MLSEQTRYLGRVNLDAFTSSYYEI